MKPQTSQKTEGKIKKHYGKYFFAFIVLGAFYNSIIRRNIAPHSLSPLQAFLVTAFSVFLGIATLYFLVLWIMNLIRRLRGIKREENKKVKLIISIIFAIIFFGLIASPLITSLNTPSNKLGAEQTVFLNKLLQKNEEFAVLNNELKAISYSFGNIESGQQLKEALIDLLSTAQELQVKIDDYKLFIEENSEMFKSKKEKELLATFRQVWNIRDTHNKKFIEFARLGLQIDFDNPDEVELNKCLEALNELSTIEMEMRATQVDFQKAIQELSQ